MSSEKITLACDGKVIGEYTFVELGRAFCGHLRSYRSSYKGLTFTYWRPGMEYWDDVLKIKEQALVALSAAPEVRIDGHCPRCGREVIKWQSGGSPHHDGFGFSLDSHIWRTRGEIARKEFFARQNELFLANGLDVTQSMLMMQFAYATQELVRIDRTGPNVPTNTQHCRECFRYTPLGKAVEDYHDSYTAASRQEAVVSAPPAAASPSSDYSKPTKLTKLEVRIFVGLIVVALLLFIWKDFIKPLTK